MPIENGDLVTGGGPDVYFIEDGKRRLVPDYTTLVALNSGGWPAVKRIAENELRGMETGRPLPSLREGSLLINATGRSFLARGGRLRPIPDAATLAHYPRRRVTSVKSADVRLFEPVVGEPLPSVHDANADVLAIDAYIRSLAPLPVEDNHDDRGPVVRQPGIAEVDGVAVEVLEQRVRMARQVADFVEISPVPDVMWAGAAVTGASVIPGSLAPIPLRRYPGWITVSTDLTLPSVRSRSRKLEEPTAHGYRDALADLIAELNPQDSAAAMSFRLEKISTLEEGMVSFGLNMKGSGWGVDAKARLDGHLDRSTTFGTFSQAYYQIAFTPEGSPPRFFTDDVSLENVKAYCGPDNPPCYIASVTYGRMLAFLVDSQASSLEVKAAFKAAWQAAVSGTADLDASYKDTLSRSMVHAVVVGGSSGPGGDVVVDPVTNLIPWIRNQLKVNRDLPAAPIQYTVRYLAPPHNLVRISRATDVVKIVDANVYGGRELAGTYQVGEGGGQGPVNTHIRLNRGDEVTITATGSIWAGWWFIGRNGPEGLDGPPKPWYPIPPVEGNNAIRGSMLIGGYDNSNWFPIGSGARQNVPDAYDDCELWLRLNDDDMTNGNGVFDVTVSVRRRLPVINALG
ncbi:thiol-activated cytolysin family protein [Streptomyces minutiscleroticus]|uniref:thiol-activated cytolysin family protein n=1 Tax=Streptomyces minutiscleroticus TaxID=68238 RepID=UPI00167EAECE|nr:thiol-activated cytolysin family protein [Streptomyces minutiscleroticus]